MTVDTGGSEKGGGEDDDEDNAERYEVRDDEVDDGADGRKQLGKQDDEETSVDSEEMDENIQMIYDNDE